MNVDSSAVADIEFEISENSELEGKFIPGHLKNRNSTDCSSYRAVHILRTSKAL